MQAQTSMVRGWEGAAGGMGTLSREEGCSNSLGNQTQGSGLAKGCEYRHRYLLISNHLLYLGDRNHLTGLEHITCPDLGGGEGFLALSLLATAAQLVLKKMVRLTWPSMSRGPGFNSCLCSWFLGRKHITSHFLAQYTRML